MRKSYIELLKDPRWQKKRLEVFQRSNFACEWCEATDKTLHVHHKAYRKGAMPWEYDIDQLECVCESCHEGYHHLKDTATSLISDLGIGELMDVIGYLQGKQLWTDEIEELRFIDAEHLSGIVKSVAWSHTVETAILNRTKPDYILRKPDLEFIRDLRKSGPT